MVWVKLVKGRTYSTMERNVNTGKAFAGHVWKRNGDVLNISERMMRHFDIAGGLKRGILQIVEPPAPKEAS